MKRENQLLVLLYPAHQSQVGRRYELTVHGQTSANDRWRVACLRCGVVYRMVKPFRICQGCQAINARIGKHGTNPVNWEPK